MIKANGINGVYPPYGIYVRFTVAVGTRAPEIRSGFTGSCSNTPSGKIELIVVDSATREVFFANRIIEWEERLPTRHEFEQDSVYYMPSVADRSELGQLSEDVQSAVALDRTLTKEGRLFVWIWEQGKWSDTAVEVMRPVGS